MMLLDDNNFSVPLQPYKTSWHMWSLTGQNVIMLYMTTVVTELGIPLDVAGTPA